MTAHFLSKFTFYVKIYAIMHEKLNLMFGNFKSQIHFSKNVLFNVQLKHFLLNGFLFEMIFTF